MITLTIKEGELRPPVFVTTEATSAEFRDKEGYLFHLVIWMRDRETVMVTSRGDKDFEWNAKNHNVSLHISPDNLKKSRIIMG